jgi:hypothetical protein
MSSDRQPHHAADSEVEQRPDPGRPLSHYRLPPAKLSGRHLVGCDDRLEDGVRQLNPWPSPRVGHSA